MLLFLPIRRNVSRHNQFESAWFRTGLPHRPHWELVLSNCEVNFDLTLTNIVVLHAKNISSTSKPPESNKEKVNKNFISPRSNLSFR